MEIKRLGTDDIVTKERILFGHKQRMDIKRLHEQKQTYQSEGKRKRGIPTKSWIEKVAKEMKEKYIEN